MSLPAAVLDVDGTLVDSNYQHAWCWHRAMRQHGKVVPVWQIHRAIGMGGDLLVPSVAGQEFEDEHGDEVRASEATLYFDLIEEVEPLPGARDFVLWLGERGHRVILSSSAKADEVEHYLDLLEVRDAVEGWTTSADVENTKPEPDVIDAALAKLGRPDEAVMIGDSVYDVQAAQKAGLPTVALLTGGFGGEELRAVGAAEVFFGLGDLRDGVRKTPLSGSGDAAARG